MAKPKTYSVHISCWVVASTTIEVQATSEEDAKSIAMDTMGDHIFEVDWDTTKDYDAEIEGRS